MGAEMVKTAKSAIECSNNLIPTFDDHGLHVPSNVWHFGTATIKGAFFGDSGKVWLYVADTFSMLNPGMWAPSGTVGVGRHPQTIDASQQPILRW
jgi:hypothetical protein